MNNEKITLPSLRNMEWRTVKAETNDVNQELTYISTNNITEFNELIYTRAKLVLKKIGILQKARKKIKTRMGSSTRNEDKNLRKQARMIKQRKDAELCRNKKEKQTQEKNITTCGNKPESTGERKKIKKISTKGKKIQTQLDIPKKRKKILSPTEKR